MKKEDKGFAKKGELTSTQIIILVLAVLSFLIVLAWIYLFQDTSYTADEVCKLSVLTRAIAPDRFQGTVPLKCSTKKICITQGGDCDENLKGEEIDKTVNLKSISGDGDKARKIEEISAEAMYDCWNMMGQGKVDIFGKYSTFKVEEPTCVVCSRIAIDESVSDDYVLDEVDIYDYMKKNGPPGGDKTYLQLFTNDQFSTYPVFEGSDFKARENFQAEKDGKATVLNYDNGREVAFVFMQIKSDGIFDNLKRFTTDAALLVGGAAFLTPKGGIASKIVFSKGTLAVAALVMGAGEIISASNAYEGQLLAAGYCGTFVTNSEDAPRGCSLVQAVPYTVNNINQLCDHLEGSP